MFGLLAATAAYALTPNQLRGTAVGITEVEQCRAWMRDRTDARIAKSATTKVMSHDTACFDGYLYSWTLADLREWLKAPTDGPRQHPYQLVVRSAGGDAEAAIDFATEMQGRRVTVTIVDYCISSCANYIYAAAAVRRAAPETALLFHGGYSPHDRRELAADLETMLRDPKYAGMVKDKDRWRADQLAAYDRNLDKQARFYRRAGVDASIATGMDGIDIDSLPSSDCGHSAKPRTTLFFSPAQLTAMGMPTSEGQPLWDPAAVNRVLVRHGFSHAACAVPTSFKTHAKIGP